MELLLTAGAALVCCFVGQRGEKKHLASLEAREALLKPLPVLAAKESWPQAPLALKMVRGSVVLSADYFRHLLSGFINIFGGRIATLERLMDRARREAYVRLHEEAARMGATHLLELRYETSVLSESSGGLPKVEVLVYATALALPTT